MTVDVACVGSPFLDLIFRGLPAMPEPGEEQLARDLVIVPGAIANVAYALNRLGLESVVCAPVGTDPAGRLLRTLMEEAGVRWIGGPTTQTPVSVALPVGGDRSFVTAAPALAVEVDVLADLDPRAVVVDLPSAASVQSVPVVYAVVGDPEVRTLATNPPRTLAGIRALVLNDREVRGLTGIADRHEAATALAGLGTTVVVTCGASGAFAVEPDGATIQVEALDVEVHDTTGAGDLFTAAYVWADLAGRGLEERLELATTYASISLAAATSTAATTQKGVTREEFEQALAEHGRSMLVMEEA